MFDLFKQVREELRLEVIRAGALIKPLAYQETESGILCYNSGGRGIVFSYIGRAKRVKAL